MHKKIVYCSLFMSLLLNHYSYANTGEFITIIGPDGLPMIVPHPERLPASKKESKVNSTKKMTNTSSDNIKQTPDLKQEKQVLNSKDATERTIQKIENSTQRTVKDEALLKEDNNLPYQLIDGEKYYESEYLESKEFNLDNKKRFYQIPSDASGSASWDVVEREKGADMSWFKAKDQLATEKREVVVLGQNYTVITKNELINALPIQCVDEKAKRKSKEFQKDDTLSIFPRTPFKDEFDYELISLEKPIQNFRMTSYANSNKKPTYYWPIAIFLDDRGCIMEGASAFHTKSYPSTTLQSASIEGVVHVPPNSKYVMLTALEQAVDLPETKLSNQGQIKLTVLR